MLSADKYKQNLLQDQLCNISVGTKFRQNFKKSGEPYLYFEITEIDNSGKLIVKVTNPKTNSFWEEDWSGDLEILKSAIQIGEYVLL